jgi:hypothetical protein
MIIILYILNVLCQYNFKVHHHETQDDQFAVFDGIFAAGIASAVSEEDFEIQTTENIINIALLR